MQLRIWRGISKEWCSKRNFLAYNEFGIIGEQRTSSTDVRGRLPPANQPNCALADVPRGLSWPKNRTTERKNSSLRPRVKPRGISPWTRPGYSRSNTRVTTWIFTGLVMKVCGLYGRSSAQKIAKTITTSGFRSSQRGDSKESPDTSN
jgi:hypothetical protein